MSNKLKKIISLFYYRNQNAIIIILLLLLIVFIFKLESLFIEKISFLFNLEFLKSFFNFIEKIVLPLSAVYISILVYRININTLEKERPILKAISNDNGVVVIENIGATDACNLYIKVFENEKIYKEYTALQNIFLITQNSVKLNLNQSFFVNFSKKDYFSIIIYFNNTYNKKEYKMGFNIHRRENIIFALGEEYKDDSNIIPSAISITSYLTLKPKQIN